VHPHFKIIFKALELTKIHVVYIILSMHVPAWMCTFLISPVLRYLLTKHCKNLAFSCYLWILGFNMTHQFILVSFFSNSSY
jgi:hypothetical protein